MISHQLGICFGLSRYNKIPLISTVRTASWLLDFKIFLKITYIYVHTFFQFFIFNIRTYRCIHLLIFWYIDKAFFLCGLCCHSWTHYLHHMWFLVSISLKRSKKLDSFLKQSKCKTLLNFYNFFHILHLMCPITNLKDIFVPLLWSSFPKHPTLLSWQRSDNPLFPILISLYYMIFNLITSQQ